MENKRVQMNLSTKQKQSYRWKKQTYVYQGVRGWKGSTGRMGLIYIHYYIFNR